MPCIHIGGNCAVKVQKPTGGPIRAPLGWIRVKTNYQVSRPPWTYGAVPWPERAIKIAIKIWTIWPALTRNNNGSFVSQ